jgi:DNA-binding NarL/FixJ family response regulator
MKLSDRDQKLVELLKEEKTYKEIAGELNAKESEVRIWMRRLRQFVGAKNSVGLVYRMIKSGVIS